MTKIKALILANRYFFFGSFLFLFAGFLFLLAFSKTGGFFYLNSYHTHLADQFFRLYTNVGDGFFSIAIFLLLLLLGRALPAWEIVFSFLLTGLVVQVLKNIFPMPRPRTLIGDIQYQHFIDGYTHVGNGSFPSGHTASVFALATILSLFGKNKKIGLLYLAAALGVAYSRIYLGQHFLQDVFAGAIIGIAGALSVYIFINNHKTWFAKIKATEQIR